MTKFGILTVILGAKWAILDLLDCNLTKNFGMEAQNCNAKKPAQNDTWDKYLPQGPLCTQDSKALVPFSSSSIFLIRPLGQKQVFRPWKNSKTCSDLKTSYIPQCLEKNLNFYTHHFALCAVWPLRKIKITTAAQI